MGESVFLGIWAVIAVVMHAVSYQFPILKIDKSGGGGVFPRIVTIIFLALIFIRIMQVVITKQTKKKFHFVEIFKGASLVYLISTAIYFMAVKYVGFIITTAIYLIWMILYCYKVSEGKKASKRFTSAVVVVVIIATIVFDWLFSSQLKVLLPEGFFGF